MALFNYLMFYYVFMLFALQFLEAARRQTWLSLSSCTMAPWSSLTALGFIISFGEAAEESAVKWASRLQELPKRTKASGVDRWSSWNLGVSKLKLELIVTVCCSHTERFISKGGGRSVRFFIN